MADAPIYPVDPEARYKAIEEKILQLFSGGSIAEKMALIDEMRSLKGYAMFDMTPLPWRIIVTEAQQISGFSETLTWGLRDIYSHLWVLLKKFPESTLITIAIDADRLTPPRASSRR